jgi:hypothetical protein
LETNTPLYEVQGSIPDTGYHNAQR